MRFTVSDSPRKASMAEAAYRAAHDGLRRRLSRDEARRLLASMMGGGRK